MNKVQAGLLLPSEGVVDIIEQKVTATSNKKSTIMLTGWKLRLVHFRLKLSLIKIASGCYNHPLNWIRALQNLVQLRRRFLGDHRVQKMAFVGGKYYMGLYTPGYNSTVYKDFISAQLHDFKPILKVPNRFNTVFMALTKKCALQCEHCYEWDSLNKKDVLSPEVLKKMVSKLQAKGVSQIQFSGGEPLLKMNSLLEVLKSARKTTEFWVVSSGFKLTAKNAAALKTAGLTGVIISLDHFLPEEHNRFRGFKDAYYWVEEAVKNALACNLVVSLSLCATREFITEENLLNYLNLAKKMGVAFVQLLEPKAVGHYAGKDVQLQEVHHELLESFFELINFNPLYNSYPIITYHGYYQRKFGCYSAGVKGMYIDTNGDMNSCPFCHSKWGNILDEDFEGNLTAMVKASCPSYPKSN